MSADAYINALEGLGLHVVVDEDITDSYQGDHALIVADGGYSFYTHRHGFLTIGYGSCSGCDAWEGASPEERLDVLRSLLNSILWFEDFEDTREYVLTHDHDLMWYGHEENWDRFVQRIRDADSWDKYNALDQERNR